MSWSLLPIECQHKVADQLDWVSCFRLAMTNKHARVAHAVRYIQDPRFNDGHWTSAVWAATNNSIKRVPVEVVESILALPPFRERLMFERWTDEFYISHRHPFVAIATGGYVELLGKLLRRFTVVDDVAQVALANSCRMGCVESVSLLLREHPGVDGNRVVMDDDDVGADMPPLNHAACPDVWLPLQERAAVVNLLERHGAKFSLAHACTPPYDHPPKDLWDRTRWMVQAMSDLS